MNCDDPQVQVSTHSRNFQFAHSGDASEHVQLKSSGEQAVVGLEHPVEASRPYDELRATVWYVSNQPGAALTLHVRLPHQIDPQTGRPLVFKIRSSKYTLTDRWEQLSVNAANEAVQQQLMLWRRRLANDVEALDTRDMAVDRVSLEVSVKQGKTELLVDDLVFGQIVPPIMPQSVDLSKAPPERSRESPIRLGPRRILVNDKPFFPRFANYQGENLDALRGMGINVAFIEHYDEQILMDELARRGIWVMAAPPQPPVTDEDGSSAVSTTGLMPIPASTSRVLFWMLGTRIPTDELLTVERWIDQIRDADRAFSQPRPIIADVVGEERAFSRKVSLLGNTRHILHTTMSPLQYRDFLQYKKNLALPDRFTFTWLQTEPAHPNVVTRHPTHDRAVFVEAEQIWMEALSAISAGHRAVGYWKSSPLDEDSSAARERRIAIALMNAQIDLLEPWLATGNVVDTIRVRVQSNARSTGSRFLPSLRRGQEPAQTIHPEILAAVIESEYGRLVIPHWYENGAQFQPGSMTEEGVSFVVRGVEQAHAWEVTTTSVRPLELDQPVPGGMEFRLPMMDQRAFVIITNNLELETKLSQKMRAGQQRCAGLWVELARARLDRVLPTHELLQQVAGSKVRDGDALLRSASQQLDQAEVQLRAQRYDDARVLSRRALRLLRQLQRSHWENAVADLTSPVSSPHTICFETLPDHWQMIEAIGRSGSADHENRLRSGDFEDFDTVRVEWDCKRTEPEDLHRVELHTDAYDGKYSLRLISEPDPSTPPTRISASPNVRVISPTIPVQGGQIVIVSGQLHIEEPMTGHPDGLLLYDNIKGTVGALRWYESMPSGQWRPFRMIREIAHSRDFQFWIELNGDGDVRFDEIRVTTLSPLQTASGERGWSDRPRRNLLDLTPSLPKFPLWSGRKTDPEQN